MNIANKKIENFSRAYVIAEIGINHNGDLELAKQLIDIAVNAGCDAVKFQKRTVEVVYTREELDQPRPNPFGKTNGDLKKGLELDRDQYSEIFTYCKNKNIDCFASPWDIESVDFLEEFDPPCYKIASATLTYDSMLRRIKATGKPVIMSIGMSTLEQIEHAIEIIGTDDLALMVCTSTYPNLINEINLNRMDTLRGKFPCPVGYSGHELGIWPTLGAIGKGAALIERHITVSRDLWGSDQKASLEPNELKTMVEAIRTIEEALGQKEIKVFENEVPVLKKLRKL